MSHDCANPSFQTVHLFDARGIAKRFRHAAIFGAMDALLAGETMHFFNDHDPLPLLNQLHQRYGDGIEISYISRDPGQIAIHFKRTQSANGNHPGLLIKPV